MKTAIIGAGISGLAAGRKLAQAGHEVVLFDKGRGPGGRMSTRRAATPLGECRWDHGAQFFTVRDNDFSAEIDRLAGSGAVGLWSPRLVEIEAEGAAWRISSEVSAGKEEARYVGTPAMNDVIKSLAKGLDIHWACRVSSIEVTKGGKALHFEVGEPKGGFDHVICATPAEQAVELLQPVSPALAEEARRVRSLPCWAVMAAFEAPVSVDWDAAKIENSPLSWVARNSSKPGRAEPETWVLHASPAWSKAHLDMDKDEVAAQLFAVFQQMTGAPEPVFRAAHRWLLAMVETGAGSPFGWDEETGIATIGDWRIAPRVEAAWQSGHSLGCFLAS